mmetsp:Transcript_79863/g.178920  ORF Transcript_79863/g.178920 Transcript_79863/m.178920 type:complete len:412 (-) Transcript_79863:228-1463(-)
MWAAVAGCERRSLIGGPGAKPGGPGGLAACITTCPGVHGKLGAEDGLPPSAAEADGAEKSEKLRQEEAEPDAVDGEAVVEEVLPTVCRFGGAAAKAARSGVPGKAPDTDEGNNSTLRRMNFSAAAAAGEARGSCGGEAMSLAAPSAGGSKEKESTGVLCTELHWLAFVGAEMKVSAGLGNAVKPGDASGVPSFCFCDGISSWLRRMKARAAAAAGDGSGSWAINIGDAATWTATPADASVASSSSSSHSDDTASDPSDIASNSSSATASSESGDGTWRRRTPGRRSAEGPEAGTFGACAAAGSPDEAEGTKGGALASRLAPPPPGIVKAAVPALRRELSLAPAALAVATTKKGTASARSSFLGPREVAAPPLPLPEAMRPGGSGCGASDAGGAKGAASLLNVKACCCTWEP